MRANIAYAFCNCCELMQVVAQLSMSLSLSLLVLVLQLRLVVVARFRAVYSVQMGSGAGLGARQRCVPMQVKFLGAQVVVAFTVAVASVGLNAKLVCQFAAKSLQSVLIYQSQQLLAELINWLAAQRK